MVEIVVTQINWNGKGDNRTFTYWVKRQDIDYRVRRIESAYNMNNTLVEVN